VPNIENDSGIFGDRCKQISKNIEKSKRLDSGLHRNDGMRGTSHIPMKRGHLSLTFIHESRITCNHVASARCAGESTLVGQKNMEFFAGGAEGGLFAEKRALRHLPGRNRSFPLAIALQTYPAFFQRSYRAIEARTRMLRSRPGTARARPRSSNFLAVRSG
jgi:hypothetical protein